MELLIRRERTTGPLGDPIFQITVQVKLTQQELKAIDLLGMRDTVLYQKHELADPGKGLLGLASRIYFRATNTVVKVSDLVTGKVIGCSSILEAIGMEDQIRESASNLKELLWAAINFNSEEVIEL